MGVSADAKGAEGPKKSSRKQSDVVEKKPRKGSNVSEGAAAEVPEKKKKREEKAAKKEKKDKEDKKDKKVKKEKKEKKSKKVADSDDE